ncbi:semaphorin-5A-like [Haliotis asinina]|uniref:semaphorin-5A-like n=1 Tax=Haliotis asinina TaxID=109174 RepID=UPI0035324CFA
MSGGMASVLMLHLGTLILCSVTIVTSAFENNGHIEHYEDRIPSDFRFTTYEEMESEFQIFSHNDITGYVQLTVDIERDQLLVGARGCLFQLALQDLEILHLAEWKSDNGTRDVCIAKGQPPQYCHNFVRVLLLHKDRVFTCGTNAYKPECTWRNASYLSEVEQTINGQAKCPYNPYQNATALMTPSGDLYTATVIDITARDPVISRDLGPSQQLRTMQRNSKWLNEPNFIASYDIGEFVYFFFRETAVEFINCGKKTYSRVARVCKTDGGGRVLLEENWTTFSKARMNCSVPGDFPFYFDEIQSTFFSEKEQLLYAIFTTPSNSLAGSAVCVYNMSAFQTTFIGPFKYQENAKSAWMKHENPTPLERCPSQGSGSKRSTDTSASKLEAANMYQLMDAAVQPNTISPLYLGENERWTHIVVDFVYGKMDLYEVVFLATADGKIRKMFKVPRTNRTCLIEEIKIVPNGEPKPVKAMKISPESGAIFISTQGRVIKIPVERCSRFTDSDLCVNSMDPYCGWDSVNNTCSRAPNGNPHEVTWDQHIVSCPIVQYPVNGNWSDWSDWSPCEQVGADQAGEDCLCRHRNCDNPKPYYGGRPCSGASIEVTNCSVHGAWTPWTPWSSCSKTCGYSIKKRERYCSNPTPRHGGFGCEGRHVDSKLCAGLPACKLPPIDGKWSKWSGWSTCTAKCQGGIQTRRRTCDQPKLSRGGIPCIGNKEEMRMCNTQNCDKVVKLTPWSPWVKTNETRGGYFQQRFRFTCQAEVPERKMIKSKYSKSQARFCFNNDRGCYTPDSPLLVHHDGGWSEWVEWSTCDQDCEGGMQWRRRSCDSPPPIGRGKDCDGHETEGRQCNTHSCYGEWSCWSSFGSCSVSCGTGIKARSRTCLTPGRERKTPRGCVGSTRDMQTCEMEPCEDIQPMVGDWSVWTECTPNSVQYRHRVCGQGQLGPDCSKDVIQLQRCTYKIHVMEASLGASVAANKNFSRRVGGVYLVIVAIIAFVIGGLASVGLFMYIQRYRDQKHKDEAEVCWVSKNEINMKPVNTAESSQISLDFQNLAPLMSPNNRLSLNTFGSLKKEKMTVNEASTLKRNSMWTNLSVNEL